MEQFDSVMGGCIIRMAVLHFNRQGNGWVRYQSSRGGNLTDGVTGGCVIGGLGVAI